MSKFADDFEKYLNLYLDNELPDSERREFENYLAENPDKAEELTLYQKLDSEAREIEVPERAEGYWEGLAGRVDAQIERLEKENYSPQKSRSPVLSIIFSFQNWAKLAAGVMVVVTVFLISRHLSDDFRLMDVMDDRLMEKQDRMAKDSPGSSIDSQLQVKTDTETAIHESQPGDNRYEIDSVPADPQIRVFESEEFGLSSSDTLDTRVQSNDRVERQNKQSEIVQSESGSQEPDPQPKQALQEEVAMASRDKIDRQETTSLRHSELDLDSVPKPTRKIDSPVPVSVADSIAHLQDLNGAGYLNKELQDRLRSSAEQDEKSEKSIKSDSGVEGSRPQIKPEAVEPMGLKLQSSQPVNFELSLDSLIEAYAEAEADGERSRILSKAIQTGLLSVRRNRDPKMIRKIEELIEEALKTELLEPELIEQYEKDLLQIQETNSQP